MENAALHSHGLEELQCSCGYFRSEDKQLYRLPNQFGICDVHEPLAEFFKKSTQADKKC